MTVEQRTTIAASDIAAIEFHCSKCRSITSIVLDRFHVPPIRCSVCSSEEAPAWMIHGSEEFRRLVELGESLRLLSEKYSDARTARFGVTFRIAPSQTP